MNPLEKLCMDDADKLVNIVEMTISRFDDDIDQPEYKLIHDLRMLVATYRANRQLLKTLESVMPVNRGDL